LWAPVAQDTRVLDNLANRLHDGAAAKEPFLGLPKGSIYVRRVKVTDRLGSYGTA